MNDGRRGGEDVHMIQRNILINIYIFTAQSDDDRSLENRVDKRKCCAFGDDPLVIRLTRKV